MFLVQEQWGASACEVEGVCRPGTELDGAVERRGDHGTARHAGDRRAEEVPGDRQGLAERP